MRDDPRLAEAKAMPMADVISRLELANLVRAGVEMVGPCPICGGKDRFGINLRDGVFQCRRECGPHSRGDQVALVQHVLGLDFRGALDWLCGPVTGISDAERDRRQKRAAENRAAQDAHAAAARANSIAAARDIWFSARPAEGTVVRDYLSLRGITPARLPVLPPVIRFDPAARYTIPASGGRRWDVIHTGPAMICAVVDQTGRLTAVHRTWLDLSQPKGKLILPDPRKDGDILPAKKVLGSKKGCAIRLSAPRGATVMVMGEGVETSLSALVGTPDARDWAVWCGVDLGNMGGRMQRGPGMKYAGRPDLDDTEAWVPPDWVRRLIFIQDGDSDPRLTRARLESGLRRAMLRHRGLIGQIAYAGDGLDLNDVLMGKK